MSRLWLRLAFSRATVGAADISSPFETDIQPERLTMYQLSIENDAAAVLRVSHNRSGDHTGYHSTSSMSPCATLLAAGVLDYQTLCTEL